MYNDVKSQANLKVCLKYLQYMLQWVIFQLQQLRYGAVGTGHRNISRTLIFF